MVSYSTTIKWDVKPVAVITMESTLRNLIARSSSISNPSAIQIVPVANVNGGVGVVLKGQTASEDEKRLIENMVMLTPGVRGVKNELQVAPKIALANQPTQ
jgi:osmotically-inducible protein OsmY